MTDERLDWVHDYQAEERNFTLDTPSRRILDRMSDLFGTLQRDSRIDDPPSPDRKGEFELWKKRNLS